MKITLYKYIGIVLSLVPLVASSGIIIPAHNHEMTGFVSDTAPETNDSTVDFSDIRRYGEETVWRYVLVGDTISYVYSAGGLKLAEKFKSVDGLLDRTRMYYGNMVYVDGVFDSMETTTGYIGKDDVYYAYVRDYQGNVAMVVNSNRGSVAQYTDYYAYGMPTGGSKVASSNRRKFGGKEYMTEFGLDEYDFEARRLDPRLGHFTTPDPLATNNHSISPWAYCNGDPINFIDPTGKYTEVADLGNGKYKVVGGSIDGKDKDDLNIYVVDAGNVRTGEIIGQSVTSKSFFNDNNNDWATGSVIDMLDISGIHFMEKVPKTSPFLLEYAILAQNEHVYDFKHTNGENHRNKDFDYYRGMHIGEERNGLPIIGSARDVGNIEAGYMTGIHGITWENTRKVFDGYQGHTEEDCSVFAQRYGWEIGMKIWRQNHKESFFKVSLYDFIISIF